MARLIKTNNGIVVANNKAISVKNYQYADGQIDEQGLVDIGWDAESIGSLRDNAPHYQWEDEEYQVSDANKALYGVVNDSNISTYATNADMEFAPMFDMSSRTNMYSLFQGASQLKGIPKWDTHSAISMEKTFNYCSNLKSIPLLNTENATTFRAIFEACFSLKEIPKFNTSRVTNFYNTFCNCRLLETVPELDYTSATSMSQMFHSCYGLRKLPRMDTANCQNFGSIFGLCGILRSIQEINFTSATTLTTAFQGCYKLEEIRLAENSSLNVSMDLTPCTILSYDSIVSILTAASNTTNSNAKTLTFNRTLTVTQSQSDTLDALIATCGAKGWTISGLTYTIG